jgi:hypothetical protein
MAASRRQHHYNLQAIGFSPGCNLQRLANKRQKDGVRLAANRLKCKYCIACGWLVNVIQYVRILKPGGYQEM